MKGQGLLRGLLLVLLVCALGSALLVVQVAGEGRAVSKALPMRAGGCAGRGFLASDAPCFAIDTSRPEWLGLSIYLPVVMRSYTP